MSNNNHRIAIINPDRCKPKKCAHECYNMCVVNKTGKRCIEIEDIAIIHADLCIGCGACTSQTRGCPFNAIKIVNIPSQIVNNLVHSYGINLFSLYGLPKPKVDKIIGIIGQNGIGKSTIMSILSGDILPNFNTNNSENVIMTQSQVLKKTRGSELQKYLALTYDEKIKISTKPQDIMILLRKLKNKDMKVSDILIKFAESKCYNNVTSFLNLDKLMTSTLITLSGGELQLVVCAIALMKDVDVYIFDEFTNYLDIEYRIKVANLIKDLAGHNKYVFVVEHDLSVLDFVADYVHIMYGEPGCYGAISSLYGTLEGINMYFDGYLPAENMRFRQEPYKLVEINNIEIFEKTKNTFSIINYDEKIIKFDNFILTIKKENITSDINMIVVLGKNGTGKSSYLKFLAEEFKGNISFKQQISNFADQKLTVQDLLYNEIKDAMSSSMFNSDVINLLGVDKIINKKVKKLSGGESQRLSIVLCLGKPADVYLLDEPSGSLDIEYRFNTIKVIKRFILHNKKIGIIVEHDILLAISLAREQFSRILVFDEVKHESLESNNIRYCETSKLLDFNTGMNKFLKSINTTFRTDKVNHRPKINKLDSTMDREQKSNKTFYC